MLRRWTASRRTRVGRGVTIPLAEIELRTSRSSGPGGQHANVTASRVEAVFDVGASRALATRSGSACSSGSVRASPRSRRTRAASCATASSRSSVCVRSSRRRCTCARRGGRPDRAPRRASGASRPSARRRSASFGASRLRRGLTGRGDAAHHANELPEQPAAAGDRDDAHHHRLDVAASTRSSEKTSTIATSASNASTAR